MSIPPFPLAWPERFPRAKWRERGAFKTALPAAIKNVQDSLRKFAADSGKKLVDLAISSNVTLGVSAPADPGVAVWFTWDALQVVIPVDRYDSVASNLQAIHHIIEARRVELRHGTLALVRATFSGFLALPAPGRGWREVLGLGDIAVSSEAALKSAWRIAASKAHPDNKETGSHEAMVAVNQAYEQARKEIGL